MSNCQRYNCFIENRRNYEKVHLPNLSILINSSFLQQQNYLHGFLKEDSLSLHRANWEITTANKINSNETTSQKEALKQQREAYLDLRRKKLSDLLISEDIQYKREILSNQETPEDVRKRMEKKLNELKLQRELERQKLVKRLEDRKFYSGADELRKNDSEYFAISCYYEQENQMLDKLKRRAKERQEEDLYVKLNELDMQKKIEREQKESEDLKNKNKEMVDYLNYQREQEQNEMNRLNEINEHEKQRLKQQWENDRKMEEEEKMNILQRNKQVNEDIKQFNEREQQERDRKARIEKQHDKDLINAILEKEKALDEIDRVNKLKKIEEFHQNKKYLEAVMNRKKEEEAWMDRIAQEEADREYEKEQKKWLKEEEARIELMKQVYKDRERAVLSKKALKEEEKAQILKERAILDNEIKKYNQRVEQIKAEEQQRRKTHQNELIYQMQEKQNMKLREMQDDLYERRAAQLWEMEYQKKIDEQRQLHLQRLAEIKNRNNDYSNNNY